MNNKEIKSKPEFSETGLSGRLTRGKIFSLIFLASTVFGIIALTTLLLSIINDSFGLAAMQYEIQPETLTEPGAELNKLSHEQLLPILKENISKGLYRKLDYEKPFTERSEKEIYGLIEEWVLNMSVLETWTLYESVFRRTEIENHVKENYENAHVTFYFWLNPEFIIKPQASTPEKAGVRTAILGTLWMILITIIVAFPLGVGTAIYLEEYAKDNFITRIIQVNIYNLAGVPSIIYGILGLAVFVRMLEPLTSGTVFGLADPTTANGRTILSAGITLALLILPIIIINSQEAIRAVPRTLRYSSYGLGATKWETIWHHVLPNSFERILTGTILAVSRAIGETAPLVVVGASTFVALDPDTVFSKFTTLPVQIYQWAARPQAEFRNVAAAAILVLLTLLLTMNASAIILRNRISRKRTEAK
jgi:phosphate transport system permease protein